MFHSIGADQKSVPLSRFARWWRDWRYRRASVADLDRCGPDEIERVARDLGVRGAELRILAGKWPGAADLLGRRMRHLKLDADDTTHAMPRVMRDLQRTCTLCQSKRQCERDLSSNPREPVWRTYCPNEITLAALVAERADGVAR